MPVANLRVVLPPFPLGRAIHSSNSFRPAISSTTSSPWAFVDSREDRLTVGHATLPQFTPLPGGQEYPSRGQVS